MTSGNYNLTELHLSKQAARTKPRVDRNSDNSSRATRFTHGTNSSGQPYTDILRGEIKPNNRNLLRNENLDHSTLGVCRDGRLMAVSEKPLRLAYSEDQGKTWTRGKRVDTGPLQRSWVWTGGRPLELTDGTLLIPVAGYLQSGWLSAGVARSTDHGDNWEFVVLGQGNPENQ